MLQIIGNPEFQGYLGRFGGNRLARRYQAQKILNCMRRYGHLSIIKKLGEQR